MVSEDAVSGADVMSSLHRLRTSVASPAAQVLTSFENEEVRCLSNGRALWLKEISSSGLLRVWLSADT